MRRLFEESPHESDALEGLKVVDLVNLSHQMVPTNLAQTHAVRHNAPVLVLNNHAGCALVQELLA